MLVISTVTKKAYIAVEYEGKEYFSQVDADCKQSEKILPEIDKILSENNIPLRKIGNIGILVGPGSFTGIRIGIALVKGLCAADNSHKVIPISTLDMMAYIHKKQDQNSKDFCCVMNALSKRFFIAKYSKTGEKLSSEDMILEEDLLNVKNNIVMLKEENLNFIEVDFTPELILEYAKCLEKERKFISADKIEPIYIRKAQAEENLH